VHPVPPKIGAKSQALAHLLNEYLPRALGQPLSFDVFMETRDGRYPDAGIVFAMYADPHGKTTFVEGTAQIAAQLRQTLGLTTDQVRNSRQPSTEGLSSMWLARLLESHARGSSASPGERPDAHLSGLSSGIPETPTRRQLGQTPCNNAIRISNRIDFPCWWQPKGLAWASTSATCHLSCIHAFASGLEGYYQEAGRAGRANQRAHVALLYIRRPRRASATRLTNSKCRAA